MEKEPLISIIVPVYNVQNYLKDCIETILAQTYKHLEIILVNDGSTDESGRMCDTYAKQDERIIVIHKENGGLSDARNAGLDIARGEYIAYIDSDDYVSAEYIEVLYGLIERLHADVAIGTFQYVFDEDERVSDGENKQQKKEENAVSVWSAEETLHHMLLQRKITTSVCGVLSKKEAWNAVRFPKGKLCEDMGTSYKIYSQADKIAYIDRVIYYYRVRRGSIQNTNFTKNKMDELEMVLACQDFINKKYPTLKEAARNRVVSCAFHILFFMKNDKEAPEESRQLKALIRKYRSRMIMGRDVNKKVRFGCASTYLGFRFTKYLYQKMGMRGKINL